MYDFDTLPERRQINSFKWNIGAQELPLWVADMDFATPLEITEAIAARAQQGVFGYACTTDAWADAYRRWWQERHNCELRPERLIFCQGGVPGIACMVRHLTQPGDKILLQTPVYNAFFDCVNANGRQVIENPLRNCDEDYSIDFEDLERKLAHPATTMMILCNPHNPVGRIWSVEDLRRIGEMCKRHGVIIISDELHGDITKPGCAYTPFENASDYAQRITCLSPTKAFNIAGLHTSAIYVPDSILFERVNRAVHTDEIGLPNAFAVQGAIAAFTLGAPWLDEMRKVVWDNKCLVNEYVHQHIPELRTIASEATYLMWLDGRSLKVPAGATLGGEIRRLSGLFLSDGAIYGELGRGYLRLNAACPRSVIEEAMERLRRAVELLR